jgi:hypothetical protein
MLIFAITNKTNAAVMGCQENVCVAKYQITPAIARGGVRSKKMAFIQMILDVSMALLFMIERPSAGQSGDRLLSRQAVCKAK